MFYCYETVASVLGPSSSALGEVAHQLTSSSVHQKGRTSPVNVLMSHFTYSSTSPLMTEKHDTEYQTRVESYMWKLVDDQSVCPSSTADSVNKLFLSNTKKQLPLPETDICEISNNGKCAKQQQTSGQQNRTETMLTGQDFVYTSVCLEDLLARHRAAIEQDHVKKTLSSSRPEQG